MPKPRSLLFFRIPSYTIYKTISLLLMIKNVQLIWTLTEVGKEHGRSSYAVKDIGGFEQQFLHAAASYGSSPHESTNGVCVFYSIYKQECQWEGFRFKRIGFQIPLIRYLKLHRQSPFHFSKRPALAYDLDFNFSKRLSDRLIEWIS